MVERLLSIINQSPGRLPEAAACQAEVVYKMRHRVKTKDGVSKTHFKRSSSLIIEGNGQGSAGSMPGWHAHTEIRMPDYKS